MRSIILILSMLLLVACNPTKTITMSYNHHTDELRANDTLQMPRKMDVWNQMDDELEITIHQNRIKSFKPVGFTYEYDIMYRNGRVYFYSPYLSNYMQDNEWFTFIVTYKKRLND